MGIQPDETEYGDDCLACYPAGKTPKYLLMFLSGIKRGEDWFAGLPLPQNGYHLLEQNPGHACRWDIVAEDPYTGFYRFTGILTQVTYYPAGIDFMFGKSSHVDCIKHFDNFETEWEDNYYYGGHCFICTTKYIADKIAELTPMFDPDPRMELFAKADGHIVIRYAGKRDATNISLEVDTSI